MVACWLDVSDAAVREETGAHMLSRVDVVLVVCGATSWCGVLPVMRFAASCPPPPLLGDGSACGCAVLNVRMARPIGSVTRHTATATRAMTRSVSVVA